jgi:hypothetical protein
MAVQPPDIVGTDIAAGRKLAAPDASPRINASSEPDGMGLSTVDSRAEATPIENSGSTLMNAADQAEQLINQQVNAAQKTWLLNASSQHELDAQGMLANAMRNAQPGQEITPILQDALEKQSQQKVAQVDNPLLQANYQNEMTQANKSVLAQAQAFDFQQRDAQVENNFKQGIDAQQKTLSLLQDPKDIEAKFGEMMAGVHDNIQSLPLTPAVKLQLLEYARKNLTDAANQTAINLDPKAFLARNTGSPQDAVMNFILQKEGSAAVMDSNGAVSKFGVNQAANPDVDVKNLTQDQAKQILQTRYIDKVVTPSMSPQMQMVAADSAVNMGVAKTNELLAQAGGDPQKMIELRKAEYERLAKNDPAQYAASLPGWLNRLNDLQSRLPDLSPRTMPGDEEGTTKQDIGGWSPMQLSDYAQRTKNIESAESYSQQLDQEAQKQKTVQNAAFNSNFDIALNRGQKTYQDIENAYQAGLITPVQRTEYTKKLDEFNGNTLKGMAAMQRVNEALGGQAVLDPKNADDRNAVDRHFEGWLQQQPQPQNDQDKAILQTKEINLAGQYGMLPKTMLGGLRASLRSTKPEDIANAAGMIGQLRQTNPVLLNDLDENDLKAANHVQALVQAGYSPNGAVSAAADELKVTPDVKQLRDEQVGEILKEKGAGNTFAEKSINGATSSWNPFSSKPGKAAIPSDMVANWNQAFKAEYLRTGNSDAATQSANDLITSNGINSGYQQTQVGAGGKRWMQNAPETFYAPPLKVDNAKWMNEQLVQDVGKVGSSFNPSGTYTPDNLSITPSGKINQDGKPTYNVWHQDDSGMLHMLMGKDGPMEWYPDWETSPERDRYKDRQYRATQRAVGQNANNQ